MTTDTGSMLIDGHSSFHAALRTAFAEVAQHGCRELWLCDNDFADWPLGERAVIEQLSQWAMSSRRLVLVARHFDEVSRRHARWVEWRRQWSHIVSCRSNDEVENDAFPTVLLATGLLSVRLADIAHHRGRFSHERADDIRCKEMIDAVLQRSEEAFPATTTGL